MDRLRVSFFIPGFSDGGAQKQCIHLLNELQHRQDLDLSLIHIHGGVHEDTLHRTNLKVLKLPVTSNYDPRIPVLVRRFIQQNKTDILISWLHACDIHSYFATRLTNTRWLLTERDSSYPDDFKYKIRKFLGRHADGIVSNSSSGEKYWKSASSAARSYVTSNIVSTTRTGSKHPSPGSTAIYVGRLEEQKNVLVLAEACSILAQKRPDFRFVFVGAGSLRNEIESVVERAGVSGQITLAGFQRDITPFLSRADAVVSLSHHEGLPNALLEAVAWDVPVVASAIPEHRELLGNDYPYLASDRHDPLACSTVIERALDDADARSALAFAHGRMARMTPEAVGDDYIRIFNDLVGR